MWLRDIVMAIGAFSLANCQIGPDISVFGFLIDGANIVWNLQIDFMKLGLIWDKLNAQ